MRALSLTMDSCRPTSRWMQAFTRQNGTETLHILFPNRILIDRASCHFIVPTCSGDVRIFEFESASVRNFHQRSAYASTALYNLMSAVSSHLQMQFISDRLTGTYLILVKVLAITWETVANNDLWYIATCCQSIQVNLSFSGTLSIHSMTTCRQGIIFDISLWVSKI